jgi:menaquinone-dependent protoporphyrinogen oxidase
MLLAEVMDMRVLVVYASKYGSTKGIAERIAMGLKALGQEAVAVPATAECRIDGYDAYVIGSAVYMGAWLKEARDLVRRHEALLSSRPVWLFSSGPLGTDTVDGQGRDVREAAVPKEIAEYMSAVNVREHRVFYGAFDHMKLSFSHRLVYAMPAAKKILPDGDFRDWVEIDGWARAIAEALVPVTVPR